MDCLQLEKTALFKGMTSIDIEHILKCLGAYTKKFKKNSIILERGSTTKELGVVMKGSVNIENTDLSGNHIILTKIKAGSLFAETYACIPNAIIQVNVRADEDVEILFINVEKLFNLCSNVCLGHVIMIKNLVRTVSYKNIILTNRNVHTSYKKIRGKLLSYFSEQMLSVQSESFTIPFNRQELADYLNVDRSALTNELSKMQKEGIIEVNKNRFKILKRGDIEC